LAFICFLMRMNAIPFQVFNQCVLKGEKAWEYESTLFLVLNPVCACISCPEEQGREMQLLLVLLLKGSDWHQPIW
jgi:hypothetical protein